MVPVTVWLLSSFDCGHNHSPSDTGTTLRDLQAYAATCLVVIPVAKELP